MYYKNSSDTVISAYAFEYDSLGRLIRSAERDSSGLVQRTEHIYDSVGRLSSQSWIVGSSNFSETYFYNDGENGNGSLSQMTTATGDSLNYTYDALHRLQKVTTKNANGTALFSTAYAFKANGTKTTPLVEYRNVRIGTSGTILEGKKYEYDAVGNIIGIYESQLVGNNTERRKLVAYTYDEQNQLLSETYYTYSGTSTTPATANVYSYTYDTVGNILTESKNGTVTKDYTYSTGDWKDLLTEFGEGKIAYEGQTYTKSTNTVSGTPTSGNPVYYDNGNYVYYMEWSHGRQLSYMGVSSSTEQFQTAYNYDADGIRTQKFVEHDTHNYITQNGKVVRETVTTDGTVSAVMDFIYDESGKPFALIYTNGTATPATYYYVLNLQGDVVALIDEEYNYVAQYTYNAWGEIITSSGTMAEINPLRYRGYYYDTETGFYYLQSRYYDPVTHRFINADSYQSTGQGIIGTNMFAYCNNNPIMFVDNTGCWFQHFIDALLVVTAVPLVLALPTMDPATIISTAVAPVVVIATDMPTREDHYNRNEILDSTKEDLPSNPQQAEEWGWQTENALYHQNNVLKDGPNVKYISKDGTKEVIFFSDETINDTPEDIGTANYCSPKTHPIGHFIKDMVPYWLWKNSPEDTTTFWQRVFA